MQHGGRTGSGQSARVDRERRRQAVDNAEQELCIHAVQRARLDQHRQRQVAEGRMDVLHGCPPRTRRRAARHRKHDVRPHAVPEHRLRAGSRERRRAGEMEVQPETGSESRARCVLRHGESRARLRRRQDLPESARHDDRGARRRNRQGTLEGQARRLQDGPDDHVRADGGQRQSDLGNQRRRVRRPGVRDGERRQNGKAGLADVQHRPRSGSRISWLGGNVEGR